jgi:hypothetical protein
VVATENDDDEFLKTLVFAEEDRHRFTTMPWRGEFRWFRSSNVVCMEKYRSLKPGYSTRWSWSGCS